MSEETPGAVTVPWTAGQVDSLNAYQQAGMMHPFTCGRVWCRAAHYPDIKLLATPSGWVCPHCDYRQDWAHTWMADWSWRKPGLSQIHELFSGVHVPRLSSDPDWFGTAIETLKCSLAHAVARTVAKRDAEDRDRRAWVKDVKQRLGLVTMEDR